MSRAAVATSFFLASLIALMLFAATPVAAGDYEDGEAAYKAGDHQKAFRLLKPLAEQGDLAAQVMLGEMHDEGEGVPEDDVRAYAWFSIAAAQGHAGGKRGKKLVAKRMTRVQIAEGQKLSRVFWRKYVVSLQTANRRPSADLSSTDRSTAFGGVWAGSINQCGELPDDATEAFFSAKLETKDTGLVLHVEIETRWYAGWLQKNTISGRAAAQTTTWYFEESLDLTTKPVAIIWASVDNVSGSNIVTVTAEPPKTAKGPFMLQVSGARECEIKVSYKGVQ